MNVTGKMLVLVAVFLAGWELAMVFAGRMDLTISRTLMEWGPWAALTVMLLATFFFWHVWVRGAP